MSQLMFYERSALAVFDGAPRVAVPRRELVAAAMRNLVDVTFAGVLADLSRGGLEPLIGGKWMSCAGDGRVELVET